MNYEVIKYRSAKRALYIIFKILVGFYSTLFFVAVNFSIISAVRFVLLGSETSTGQFWISTGLAGLGGLVAILLACWITLRSTFNENRNSDSDSK